MDKSIDYMNVTKILKNTNWRGIDRFIEDERMILRRGKIEIEPVMLNSIHYLVKHTIEVANHTVVISFNMGRALCGKSRPKESDFAFTPVSSLIYDHASDRGEQIDYYDGSRCFSTAKAKSFLRDFLACIKEGIITGEGAKALLEDNRTLVK